MHLPTLVTLLSLASASDPVASDPAAPEPSAAPATAPASEAWYSDLTASGFVDGYAAGHWTLPNAVQADHGDVLGHRAFDVQGGLALAFAGVDATYDTGDVGATVNLRFGSATPRLLGAFSGLPEGMGFVKQALVTWRPSTSTRLDFGQFDTPFGAEVSESWMNPTYTRGALYTVLQPYYHAGFRAEWSPLAELTLRGMLVNGWNNVLDNNDAKSVGVQAAFKGDGFGAALGYLVGPEGEGNNARLRHLVDVVATASLAGVELSSNADVVVEEQVAGGPTLSWGVMGAGRVPLGTWFATSLRGEYLRDELGNSTLTTGTVTLEATPAAHIVIRLDTRLDVSSDPRFIDTKWQPSPLVASSVLGLIVKTN